MLFTQRDISDFSFNLFSSGCMPLVYPKIIRVHSKSITHRERALYTKDSVHYLAETSCSELHMQPFNMVC